MPDVRVVNFDTQYEPTKTVAASQASALNLIRQLLQLRDVTDQHLKEQLSIGLWKWTEAAGVPPYPKFNLRYISEGVKQPLGPASINHEHVWPRKWLIKELRTKSWTESELRDFLELYGVACVVTVAEHAQLSGSRAYGWDRYADAAIRVWDRQHNRYKDLTGASTVPPGGTVTSVDLEEDPADVGDELATDHGEAKGFSAIGEQGVVELDLSALLAKRSTAPIRAHLSRLIRMARFASAVAVPAVKKDGQPAEYFRIHDALIGEPTPAVAYPHWTGRVAFRLRLADVPAPLTAPARLTTLRHDTYQVQVRVDDNESVELAEELLFLSLEKLRSEQLP